MPKAATAGSGHRRPSASPRPVTGSQFPRGRGSLPDSNEERSIARRIAAFVLAALAYLGASIISPPWIAARAQVAEGATKGGEAIEIGRSYVLRSKVLGDDRRIAVYLPAHYADPTRRFTVIYLLDGGAKEDFHHITGLADISAAYGLTREFIVVGIEGKDRRHDLTGPSVDPGDLTQAPTSGGSAAYRRFIVEELKPWVDRQYRTDGHSALMGESLAGLFVVETLLRSPTSFDDYIAVSPSLWWNRQALSRQAARDLKSAGYGGRRLWLSVGDEVTYHKEMREGIYRFMAALRGAKVLGFIWKYSPMPSETHATIYHPAAMAALRYLYALEQPGSSPVGAEAAPAGGAARAPGHLRPRRGQGR